MIVVGGASPVPVTMVNVQVVHISRLVNTASIKVSYHHMYEDVFVILLKILFRITFYSMNLLQDTLIELSIKINRKC